MQSRHKDANPIEKPKKEKAEASNLPSKRGGRSQSSSLHIRNPTQQMERAIKNGRGDGFSQAKQSPEKRSDAERDDRFAQGERGQKSLLEPPDHKSKPYRLKGLSKTAGVDGSLPAEPSPENGIVTGKTRWQKKNAQKEKKEELCRSKSESNLALIPCKKIKKRKQRRNSLVLMYQI